MAECPICGLQERCRNHWVAVQEPSGEVEFQVGAMTASEDNLVLLRNKLKNPPLRALFQQIALSPTWVEEQGRTLAYLNWPLDLRGAVHRSLFPNGAPGQDNRPLPPTPMFIHRLEEVRLKAVTLDLENCMPDELIYKAQFALTLEGVGEVEFEYVQIVWADGIEWSAVLADSGLRAQAQALVQLLMAGLVDPLRGVFSGRNATLLTEAHPQGLAAGDGVDEVALEGEVHLGETIEKMINERRLQPLLRDSLLGLGMQPAAPVQ